MAITLGTPRLHRIRFPAISFEFQADELRGAHRFTRQFAQGQEDAVVIMRHWTRSGTTLLATLACQSVEAAQSQLVKKITINASVSSGIAGFSTAIDQNIVFLGAPAGTSQPGLGYTLNLKDNRTPRKLEPSAQRIDSLFGFDADLNGSDLVIGDPANPNAKIKIPGSAYLFDAVRGSEIVRLRPSDSFAGNEFGYSVSTWNSYAAIGAPNLGVGEGSAYLFDLRTGDELFKLTASDAVEGAEFGSDVAVSDDYVVVGAPMNPEVLGYVPGAAYVYSRETGQQLFKLQSPDGIDGDEFGFDVAVQGNLAVIGAPYGGVGYGAAYVYDLATGKMLLRLVPSDNVVGNDFGATVDLWGDKIAVGASGLNSIKGAVYVFDAMKGTQLDKISPTEIKPSDSFGLSFSIYQNQLLIGSPRDDTVATNAGGAYLYELAPAAELGDFNRNERIDVGDIDLLTAAVRSGKDQPQFDLTGDLVTLSADRVYWVEKAAKTYFGDSNLDGVFDSLDFLFVFRAGVYEDKIAGNATWAKGDWNGDGDFDSGDILWAYQDGHYNKGSRKSPTETPEPASATLSWPLIFILARLARVQKSGR